MKDNVWSFHYQYRNANPFMESFRDEKFTTCHKRLNPIPHSWLSSCGKIEIPHSRLRRSWGISISPRLLSHSWGIGISLLWLVVNFQFLHLRLRRSCRNYPVPETFHKWIGSFPYSRWKLTNKITMGKIPDPGSWMLSKICLLCGWDFPHSRCAYYVGEIFPHSGQ